MKKMLYLILPIITLILEVLPYGAVCNFANPEGEPWRKTYSYFDITPYGYANFAPFITAIITCIIFVLVVVFCLTGKQRPVRIAKVFLCACAVISLGPLLLGINYFSLVGIFITISLIAELLLLHFTIRKTEA